MNVYERLCRYMGSRKRRALSREAAPSAIKVSEEVDEIIRKARSGEKKGIRKDVVLFEFEREVEEISDAVTALSDGGQKSAYREICRKLYEYAREAMSESYMPMYLYILYRYAQAKLDAGETKEAEVLFGELYEGTDRLIGVRNTYGIHCLERIALCRGLLGKNAEALRTLEKMRGISEEEYGKESAMTSAVTLFTERMQREMNHNTEQNNSTDQKEHEETGNETLEKMR